MELSPSREVVYIGKTPQDQAAHDAMTFLCLQIFDDPRTFGDEKNECAFFGIRGDDGELLAAIGVYGLGKPEADIGYAATVPEERGTGMAGELLRHAEDVVVALGGTSITVTPADEAAVGFFENRGYAQLGADTVDFYKKVPMSRELLVYQPTS